ncbi:magnesium transporter CorA family protein [Actinomadura rupiterrae]|uniref:magnesium transporter CorA family protein n=1 Tax=Actinomadura rupiterrae TaxID=559627 RepID=UPI0020A57AD2|nr:magnesium transporter CorA family protein [Actinomadura rupiterrae]MCP2336903.1 magnesium transporter [Actinomadura rupiterrae]
MTDQRSTAGSEDEVYTEPPRTRAWHDGVLEAENFPVDDVSEYLKKDGTTVWLDLCGPQRTAMHVISRELDLDRVAVEDAVSRHERTKLDRYTDYVFLNLYLPKVDGVRMTLYELSAFVTANALVTVREDPGFPIDELIGRWDRSPDFKRDELAGSTVALLLYGLLDLVVDYQLTAAQSFDDEADELEELVFRDDFPVREIQQRSFTLRKNLFTLRRVSLPMREILNTLLRRDLKFVSQPLVPYYQDVYDHSLRVGEFTDALRDLIANLLDTRIALQGNRLNEVMKKVTSWAAIIAVPTAITGFYGQNVPYPGFGQHWGFWLSSAVIITLSGLLYTLFKTRDWL